MGTTTRDLMLRLTPEVYLARGYLDASGSLRRLLKGEVATAAAMQLMQAELSPQEFGLTVEGLRQLLPLHDEPTAPERLHATLQEAVEVVARIIQQPNNGGLVQWISACATAVTNEAELRGFMEHLDAVNRHYAVLVASSPPDPSPGSSPGPPSASPSASAH
jgi:hypothetical protein